MEILERLAGVFSPSPTALQWDLPPRYERMVTSYILNGTRNPYIAHSLVTIAGRQATQNGSSPITIEEAIDRIESDRLTGVFYVVDTGLITGKLSGGGALRGNYYKGEQKAIPILFKINYGVSSGSPAAIMYDGRTRFALFGQNALNGLDVSQKSFDRLADEMSLALHNQGGVKYVPYSRKVAQAFRGIVGEAFLLKEPIMEAVKKALGDTKVCEAYKLRIGVSDLLTGRRIVVSSENGYGHLPMYEIVEQSSSFPIALSPVRKPGIEAADGGLNAMPIRAAARESDLLFVTVLNLYIPHVDRINGRLPMGTVRQAYRMYEILQSDATREVLTEETSVTPEELINGDPHGRILAATPNLSDYSPFELSENHSGLENIGRGNTQSIFGLLDPSRRPEHYNPRFFLESLRLKKLFGDNFRLVMN